VRSVLVCVALFSSLSAFARPQVTIDVAIDPAHRTARGTVDLELTNETGGPLPAVELWRYPAHFAHLPPELNDFNFYWVYPRVFSPGSMALEAVTVDGQPARAAIADSFPAGRGTLYRIPLAAPLPPGGRVHVAAKFSTTIPERYGPFGCVDRACTLAGGFYPMPVEQGAEGWQHQAPPARSDVTITVAAPPGSDLYLDGKNTIPGTRTALPGVPFALVTVEHGLYERTLVHDGVTVRFASHTALPPPPEEPPGKAMPYLGEDRAQIVLDATKDALDLLGELGLSAPRGSRIDLVEAPLRLELAQPAAGAVLVSDRIFRIVPVERFRKFHTFQLVRAIFAQLCAARLAERERPGDLGWSPDVAASWLVDQFTLRDYRKSEFARDILRWVAFIPTIDRILYAPQIPFATAYFNSLDDPDPTRADPMRFSSEVPRGKVIYEKLRDRLGDPDTAQVVRAEWSGEPLREAAERVAGSSLAQFFAQWLGKYPQVDYRFEVVGEERKGIHRVYRIRVYKRGPHPPVEKVELRLTEWGGQRHDLAWDGEGREHVFTVETERTVQSIELDPRGRLSEHLDGENDDMRLGNRSPSAVKFIYNNFGGLINFQNLSLDLSLDFSLSRIYDVKNSGRFVIYRSQTTQVGLLAAYGRNWGRLVTPSRTTSGASVGITAARLEPTFGRTGEAPQPGTRLTFSASLGYDDRLYIWEPWRAWSFGATANYVLTVLDDGRVLQQGSIGVSGERIAPLAVGHGIAVMVGAAATFGDLQTPSQMLSAGAPSFLRGYEADELLGPLRATLQLEYRHTFVHDLDWNIFHLVYIRGISGAVFTEVGAITECGTYSVTRHDLFGDVGYSLRLVEEWLGVGQTVFNVDVAIPSETLTRSRRPARPCFQEPGVPPRDPSTRAPVGVFVYWGPIW
jgi:hypothetical protein